MSDCNGSILEGVDTEGRPDRSVEDAQDDLRQHGHPVRRFATEAMPKSIFYADIAHAILAFSEA